MAEETGRAGAIARQIVTEALEGVTVKVTLDLWRRLAMYTPVDTGRARAGWNIAKGERTARYTPPEGVYAFPAIPPVPYVRGQDIYITNNVSYIESLDEGSSQQAPEGFSERATDETVRKFTSEGGEA